VVFVSHATEREVRRRDGSKYDRIQPTMANTARDVVEGMVDIWAYYHYEGKDRYLQIKGDDHISAGHRLQQEHFRWNGREVDRIWMGRTPVQAYENLLAAFANTYNPNTAKESEGTAPPIRLALKKRA
jgi:AAA domain